MRNRFLFSLPFLPLLLSSCSFSKPSTSENNLRVGGIYFGKTESKGLTPFKDEYTVTSGFPLFSLTSECLYSDGPFRAVRFDEKSENISSLSLSFSKGMHIEKIRFYTFGEIGSSLTCSYSEALPSVPLENKTLQYSKESFQEISLEEQNNEIDYLFLSNLNEKPLYLAQIEFTYFGDFSSSSSVPLSSSSSLLESSNEDSSFSNSLSSISSSSDSSEVPTDYGESDPNWTSLAAINNAWPKETYEYRLKPFSTKDDIAPIYSLSKKGEKYVKTLVKYLSKEKKCYTYNDVCEYYMAFGCLPSNYTLDSSPEKGSREERRYQVFSRKKHYATDYPSKLGTFNNESSGLYYELDVDLTGSYNRGNGSYSRGAGRVVIVPEGLSEEGYGSEPVCYFTLDHYADFVEYYNFQNAWSSPFKGVYNRSGSYENTPFSEKDRSNPLTISL